MPGVSKTVEDNLSTDAPKRPDQFFFWPHQRPPGYPEPHTAEDFLQYLAPDSLGTV